MQISNIIVADFTQNGRKTATASLWQYDYGQILQFEGITLPEAYEVHFSNAPAGGTTITQIGNADGVSIPDQFLLTGKPVFCWMFVHTGENDGETEYQITIPVCKRPQPSNQQPSPVEQSAITEAIAALNLAVEETAAAQTAAELAQEKAETAQDKAEDAQEAAETAQDKAEDAQTAAENARDRAENAQTAAELAQGYAESARDAASGSATAAAGSASDAEAYAVGKRGGVVVSDSDTTYHNNAKYYAQQAGSSAGTASNKASEAAGSASAASGYKDTAEQKAGQAVNAATSAGSDALKAEGYAVGKQNGDAVASGSPYYQNNAKYYATEAGSSASGASNSAASADADALKAEGYAVGKQDGTDVGSGSPYYQNNAAYYAGQAGQAAELVGDLATEATLADIEEETETISGYLRQIVEEGGHSSDLNGYSLSPGAGGEIVFTYTNPEDPTDVSTITAMTDTTLSAIAAALAELANTWKGAIINGD